MDPFLLSAVTYLMLALGAWAGFVVIAMLRIMHRAKKLRGSVRSYDRNITTITAIMAGGSLFVTFIWPGLIYMIPSAVAFFELASIPILGYLSEFAFKHWQRIKGIPVSEVDEHASI